MTYWNKTWKISREHQDTTRVTAGSNRKIFPSKAICNQIQLCHPCGVLMLKCGYVQSESSQSCESSMWQTDSSGLTAKPGGLYSREQC